MLDASQLAVRLFPGGLFRVFESLEVVQGLDGDERVLVHRVTMVEISSYQRVNRAEFRDKHRKQLETVHCAQSLGSMRKSEDLLQTNSDFRRACGSCSHMGQ